MSYKTILLLFACFISYSKAGDCQNPLIELLRPENQPNATIALPQPEKVNGLKYCKRLSGAKSCCKAGTINGINGLINSKIRLFENEISKKDTALKELFKSFSAFASAYLDFNTTLAEFNTNSNYLSVALELRLGTYVSIIQALWDQVGTMKMDFASYQTNRKTCMEALLNVTAGIACLACDPDYSTLGVSKVDGVININLHTGVCETIQRSCEPYMDRSWRLAGTLKIQSAIDYINKVEAIIALVSSTKIVSNFDISPALEELSNANTTDIGIIQTIKPPSCYASNMCTWACTEFFDNFLNVTVESVVLGGINVTKATTARILESTTTKITYNSSGYNTNSYKNLAGVTVNAPLNPSGVYIFGARLAICGSIYLIFLFLFAAA